MKRALIGVAAGALLVAPGAIAKPTKADRTNAAQECRAERGGEPATREAFRAKYGTNKNKSNAFGKCVSRTAVEEAAERRSARSNAAKDCKAEREADPTAFGEKYGTGPKNRNAFGKCVSALAKAKKAEADEEDAEEARERKSAAKECAAERSATGDDAFRAKYGTAKAKGRNAFGKCVSQKASA